MADPRQTPAMRQYYRFKRERPDCVLLFRIGDFYEMFDDDAVNVSRAIGLTLTRRTEGVPMAGVPFHQLDTYLRKLLDAGFRVAVAEQTEEAAEVKARGGGAVIERAVTRVLTPGTLVDDALLPPDASGTLAAVCFTESGDHSPASVAVVDISTGAFEVFEAPGPMLGDELLRRRVRELVYASTADGSAPTRVQRVLEHTRISGTPAPGWHFRPDEAHEALVRALGVMSLEAFGLSASDPLVLPAGALVRYLIATQMPGASDGAQGGGAGVRLGHLSPPRKTEPGDHLVLDATTIRALEVLRTIRDTGAGEGDASLAGVFSPSGGGASSFAGCVTAMGRRTLREWLCRPLCDAEAIRARQACVRTLVGESVLARALEEALGPVQDLSRIGARLALGRASPRDLVALGRSLGCLTQVRSVLTQAGAFAARVRGLEELARELEPIGAEVVRVCVDEPPAHLREGGLIKDGVDAELDEARLLQKDAQGWMTAYQQRLIAEHDLPSLKVGYNKIFGFYIELPAAQSRRAPAIFTRKQTLKNAERYISPELKEFEVKVTSAETRALSREQAIFDELCAKCAAHVPELSRLALELGELDVLSCFAGKARQRGWVCPELSERAELVITQGRHPVLEERLGQTLVPNDVDLGSIAPEGGVTPALALITGPNMAGKSTFIRTAGLITLLAHTGSFVPAQSATVGITDRIFTRIGADDALHAGQSTFMVEMTETARILHHATPRSLVILDEIGRGTSTLDGLSLAWAIAETLAGGASKDAHGPRVLFATHYHELTELADQLSGRVQNLHVAVREWNDEIVFLHRILPGRTDKSYGIHVAKLAGLPSATIARAREVMDTLSVHHHGPGSGAVPPLEAKPTPARPADGQLSLFTEYVHHPAIDQLRQIKIDALSPLAAFDHLRALKALTDVPG